MDLLCYVDQAHGGATTKKANCEIPHAWRKALAMAGTTNIDLGQNCEQASLQMLREVTPAGVTDTCQQLARICFAPTCGIETRGLGDDCTPSAYPRRALTPIFGQG